MTGTRINRTKPRLYATRRRKEVPRAKTLNGFRAAQPILGSTRIYLDTPKRLVFNSI
jgi:hypothetical protein